MNCTVCYRVDARLTPIETNPSKQYQLCSQCISDLFTAELDTTSLSTDSDDSKSNTTVIGDVEHQSDLEQHCIISCNVSNDDNVSLKLKTEASPIECNDSANTDNGEVRSSKIKRHKAIPKILKVKCSICGEQSVNRKSLAVHMRKNHPEEKINRCNICHLFFKGAQQFEEHIQNVHSGFSYECTVCLEGYNQGEKLEHEKVCLGRLLYGCGECNDQYISEAGLQKHFDGHRTGKPCESQSSRTREKVYICALCEDDRVYEENSYWNHIHELHDGRYLRCPDCGKTFRSRKHMVVHTGVQCKVGTRAREISAQVNQLVLSKCELCPKTFRNRTLLQNHVTKVHNAKPVVCDLCGLGFTNRNQMRYHQIKLHTEPTQKCPHCDKRFHLASDLRQHLTSHEQTGKFICEECGRVFKRKMGLTLHAESHREGADHPNRRMVPGSSGKHACELCDRRFKYNYLLTAHMKVHDPDRVLEKKYACKECDAMFTSSAGLYHHMKGKYVHQKMKCSVCSAVIKGKERYAEHLALHSGKS